MKVLSLLTVNTLWHSFLLDIHVVILQEKKLLDLPKLLDICAIYGHENEELTRSIVSVKKTSDSCGILV